MSRSTFASVLLAFIFVVCITSCEPQPKPDPKPDAPTWNEEDHKGVKAAIADYVEGLYQVDSTRIERSVDSTLRKLGYWYNPKDSTYRDNLYMSYNSLVSLAARWNKDGSQVDENSPKKIEIYDINSKTASAKLTAAWGIDYFHLGKVNGQWKIFNVIWQSMPEEEE
jgi:hypothetical protein